MEKFKIIQPSIVLAPYVKHYWLLESNDVLTTQRIIPTGHIELVFHRGSPLQKGNLLLPAVSLSGQSIGYSDLNPTGAVRMIVVVFHPFGAKAFFDMPLHELSDLSTENKELRELGKRIRDTADDEECIAWIETYLTKALVPLQTYNYKRMAAAVNVINQKGGEVSTRELAELTYLSEKQFSRVFNDHIGTTPKDFTRTVRFHKALFTLQNNPSISLTLLAHACGYFDQSHMIREFKLFSGYTPSEYMAVCAPYSDYFSK